MGERSYLSIGDVLALLRDEFPDITISKIRFLESRGLLVPERTPSGYRKFYDHDVDRLRWILRQQREHFLPLKVIKGRLEGAEGAAQAESLFDTGEAPPAEMIETEHRSLAPVSSNGSAQAHETSNGAGVARSLVTTMPRERHPSAYGVGGDAPSASEPPAGREAPRDSAPKDEAPREGEGIASAKEPESHQRQVPPVPPASSRTSSAHPTPAREPAVKSEVAEEASRPRPALSGAAVRDLVGTSLTADELAQASGLTVAQVAELESFGLIEGRDVAGVHCYDEEALVLGGLAAGFARFGIEARHLRIFKHAAERQAGLYSQVVMPLLRQRNPESRARADEDLQRLAELGVAMQACFSRAVLHDLTGR